MDYEKLMTVLRQLALQAGDRIMEIYGQDDFDVRSKADESPVTAADEAADALISAGLREAFPELTLVTEEQAETHSATGDTFLIVDPLDGTKEFVHRRGEFTVNIALVEGGVPTRGIVYAPAKKRLFYTDASGKSVEETSDLAVDRPGPTRVLNAKLPADTGLMVVASKSHRDQATDDYIARYDLRDMTSAGSSLKFCLVAAGSHSIVRPSRG